MSPPPGRHRLEPNADPSEAREARGGGLPRPSPKARALRLLARREHSRAELRRKLLREDVSPGVVDALLDQLESSGLLSDRRYAEVLAHTKGSRFGVGSLSQTLSRQGVSRDVVAQALAPLGASERDRALAIWKNRFGTPPVDLRERARQHRFLLGRGFDPGTVSWVFRQAGKIAAGD